MAALTLGTREGDFIVGTQRKLEPKISRSSLLIAGPDDQVRSAAYSIDLQFSALSSLSRDSRFDGRMGPAPDLRLGALLRSLDVTGTEEDEPLVRFWICLQPLCDSVRLETPTQFPLLSLQKSTVEDRFDFIVPSAEGYVPLEAKQFRLREIALPVFSPETETQTVVASWAERAFAFTSSDGVQYEWLGQVRLEKAHKFLHALATVAGRIGIDEYEYLRLAATR
jgi:hypothetical protein